MALNPLLAALLLASLATAAVCPTFTCASDLPKNVCGNRLSEESFQINADGCDDGDCSVVQLRAWALEDTASTFECRLIYDSIEPTANWTAQRCYQQDYEKDFRANTTATCYSDSDCELADGTYAACVCVFRTDGLGICKPDKSNPYLFAGYWQECKDNNQHIVDQHSYLYWTWLMQYWEWTQTDLQCMDVFWEVDKLSQLLDKYEGAVASAVCALTLAIALY